VVLVKEERGDVFLRAKEFFSHDTIVEDLWWSSGFSWFSIAMVL
jgi:hypothetical protein